VEAGSVAFFPENKMALKAMGGRAAAIPANAPPWVPTGEELPEAPALKSETAGTLCAGKAFKESAVSVGWAFSASMGASNGEGFSHRPGEPDGEAAPGSFWLK
jgi:hypothetical protein